MIEQVTPQLLSISLLLVMIASLPITALVSLLLLWRYRLAVTRSMHHRAGEAASGGMEIAPPPAVIAGEFSRSDHLRRALGAPRRDALIYVVAILVAALPLSLVAQSVFQTQLGVAGFVIGVAVYSWPAVAICLLLVPRPLIHGAGLLAAYFLIYVGLSLWAATIQNVSGGVLLEDRSGVTPQAMMGLWISVNALPTLLCGLCFLPLVRSIAGLVLAMVSLLISGFWFATNLLITRPVLLALERFSIASGVGMVELAALGLVLVVLLLLVAGWQLTCLLTAAHRRQRVSDRSLYLDAAYLIFLSMYTLWLVLGGLVWLLCLPLAFGIYKLMLWVLRRLLLQRQIPRNLCFLRVFALGRRSLRLLEAVAGYWRSIGSIQLIVGPDVATRTVRPDQFLAFLGRRLGQKFVSNRQSLLEAVQAMDRLPDPDGRFRINTLFCYQDTWQSALPSLLRSGEMVLMDLRGFSDAAAGCREELNFIAAHVPAEQCLLLVDSSTDRDYLNRTLQQALAAVPADGCNASLKSDDFPRFEFRHGDAAIRKLVSRLCCTTHATPAQSEALQHGIR
ncbi:hypothetical protein [Pseudomaricurvus sp. HS19]|uniref:hypothetical protein n=1 Tax=Pseudomaricurvus sp. HS19 TaxID=2692626 RepID=UPI00136D2E7E|nr:hypothetical protein [Pseudomaricurvus sp. HS19]MYM62809.1 hypothetical protein [Pseudomaricurvus sp. HS19]